jgi:hypothetical protein
MSVSQIRIFERVSSHFFQKKLFSDCRSGSSPGKSAFLRPNFIPDPHFRARQLPLFSKKTIFGLSFRLIAGQERIPAPKFYHILF